MTEQHADRPDFTPYDGPAGGWGSMRSLADIIPREKNIAETSAELLRQNKPDGFACVSCAWAKPHPPGPVEFCENGAKATAWEITSQRVTPDFFRRHTLTDLRGWSDYRLEEAGRLTHPMKYDPATDKYVVAPWEEAFKAIAARLKPLNPKSVVFDASVRACLATSCIWQLLARLYGNQNLPDSSNMFHKSTSLGLKTSIGVPVGTTRLEDFDTTECILHFG
ncbi:molybdopterin-dependent oxidoreductase, partial [Sphingomonas endophytica]|uniref:molybdopterin-dependent oxidoreductase n=1 Tax=Sphingomonas endophytica TaxID=869719 RepID=UPI000B17C40E